MADPKPPTEGTTPVNNTGQPTGPTGSGQAVSPALDQAKPSAVLGTGTTTTSKEVVVVTPPATAEPKDEEFIVRAEEKLTGSGSANFVEALKYYISDYIVNKEEELKKQAKQDAELEADKQRAAAVEKAEAEAANLDAGTPDSAEQKAAIALAKAKGAPLPTAAQDTETGSAEQKAAIALAKATGASVGGGLAPLPTPAQRPSAEDTSPYLRRILYVDETSSSNIVSDNSSASIGLKRLIRYAEDDEGNFPAFVLDQLVYVQGVEISKYLKGAITISKNNVSGHNTLSFTLDNAYDKFVWTDRNLSKPVFDRDTFYTPDGIQRSYDSINPDESYAPFMAVEELKKKIFEYKSNKEVNPVSVDAVGNLLFTRFDLVPNKCIFNRMDPIRVFSLYPFRVGQTESDTLWIPEFTGFVDVVSIEDDEVNGTSTITVECVDARQAVINKMRISSSVSSSLANPLDVVGFKPLAIYDEGENARATGGSGSHASYLRSLRDRLGGEAIRFFSPEKDNVVFYDDVVNSKYDQVIPPNLNLEGTIKELMVFKRSALVSGRARRGINNIEYGGTFYFNAKANREFSRSWLSEYHKFCLFGPKRRPWTRAEVEAVGKETKTTGEFWPLNCRLWFLLPSQNTGPSNLADLQTAAIQMAHQANWTTRLEVIRNVIESMDYQMYVSGTGDFHVEFPMADFRPEDFGEFQSVFRVQKAGISLSYSDEAEEPVAGVIVSTGFNNAASGENLPDVARAVLVETFAFSPYVAARYGMNIAQPVPFPFLSYKDKAIAQQRAVIEMQKANARCHTLQFQSSYRPFLLPNRPIHLLRRTRMGTAVSIETTFEIGAQPKATVAVGLEHVRAWTGNYLKDQSVPNPGSPRAKQLEETETSPKVKLDDTSSLDPVSQQVFATVMAGVNTPTSPRREWGTDSILTAESGVYVLDLQKFREEYNKELVSRLPVIPAEEVEEQDVGEQFVVSDDKIDYAVVNRAAASPPLSVSLRVTSKQGWRMHPVHKVKKMHYGIDLKASTGTPALAIEKAVVHKVGSSKGGGNFVVIRTADDLYIRYFHLDSISVKEGTEVNPGQEVGKVGNTGASTGPHLHIEARSGGETGQQVNIAHFLGID